MSENDTQKTLVVLKPDAVQRGIIGEIISRFERAGLKIIAMKLIAPSDEHFHKHYEEIGTLISRHGKEVYDVTVAAMVESPVIAMVLEGVEAIPHVRKMVGATDPKEAAPGTIRGDFTHISRAKAIEHGRTLPNLIHASATPEEAKQEISLWFEETELLDYKTPHQETVHGWVPKES
ncbi:MAG TPA: nucleoside-diphosphate kinase [Candidatus Saccharimonadales bacterium]